MRDSLSAKQKEQKTTESKFNCFPSLKVLRNSCVESHFSRVWFFSTPMDCSPPGSSVHGILQSRLLEWLPCPPPGDLPNLGTEPESPASPPLQADSLPLSHWGNPKILCSILNLKDHISHVGFCALTILPNYFLRFEGENNTANLVFAGFCTS